MSSDFPDLRDEVRRMSGIQEKLDRYKQDLEDAEIRVKSRNNVISVDISGSGRLESLTVSGEFLDHCDAKSLSRELLSTIQAAQDAASAYRTQCAERRFSN